MNGLVLVLPVALLVLVVAVLPVRRGVVPFRSGVPRSWIAWVGLGSVLGAALVVAMPGAAGRIDWWYALGVGLLAFAVGLVALLLRDRHGRAPS